MASPHETYAQWAAIGPVVEVPERNAWLISGYGEAAQVLRHPATATGPVPSPAEIGRGDARLGVAVHQTLSRMAVLSNGPYHRGVRLALQPSFGADIVETLRPTIGAAIGDALDSLRTMPLGARDLDATAFCDVLVSRVLDDACGVPAGLGARLRTEWARAAAPVERPDADPASDTPALVLALHEELLGVMAAASAQSGMLQRPIDVFVREAGRRGLGPVEAAANLLLVLTSGHRTLRHSLALAIHSLAADPRQQHILRHEPERVASSVEELLRWDNAVPATIRVATDDITLGGHRIGAGSTIGVLLAAANRDQWISRDPERLDVMHPPRRHLGFGRGAHFCPGAGLSRVLMTESLTELLRRTSSFTVAETPRWLDNRRGLADLRLAVQ